MGTKTCTLAPNINMSQREKKIDEREVVVEQEVYEIYEALVHSPALVM